MIITVNHITIAKKSDCIPCLIAKAVARETTTDECTDGIPPLPSALDTFHFHEDNFTIVPFAKTARRKDIAGIKIMLS